MVEHASTGRLSTNRPNNMKKYKVQITQSQSYILDVLADNPKTAKRLASEKWNEVCENGTYHYHEDGGADTEISHVFDVTDTDDPHDQKR